MDQRRVGVSRRQLLAASALVFGIPGMAIAGELRTRDATAADVPDMVALLFADARRRVALVPALWAIAPDAATRIEAQLRAAVGAAGRDLWIVAEAHGRIVGIGHGVLAGTPPIFDAPPAGLIQDDSCVASGAPAGTRELLVAATEAALRARGAALLIGACVAGGAFEAALGRAGYVTRTLYLVRSDFAAPPRASGVRAATADDVAAIASLGADNRRVLAGLEPRFWHPHADADARFAGWMRASLALPDRRVLVAGEPVRGFVIPQPLSPMHLPAAHDSSRIGMIDDFHDRDFADPGRPAPRDGTAAALLAAADAAFAARGYAAALAVCPAAWDSKKALLEGLGYRTARLWMVKPA